MTRWILVVGSLVIISVLAWMLVGSGSGGTLTAAGLALLLGGATGNVTDRILHGAVTDFLEIWLGHYRWPAFNVADSAIAVGATLVILDVFFGDQPKPGTQAALRPMNIDSELEHDPEDEDLPVGSAPSAVKQTLVVEDSDAGERLDRYVTARCTELSRSRVQELIAAGLVLADSRSAKGSRRVHAGEVITVDPQPRPPLRAEAEIIPLDVLYEDEDVIAINKPAGMVVHAGAGNSSGTLVNALLGRGTSLAQSGWRNSARDCPSSG